MVRARSSTSVARSYTAEPPACSDRDPHVPWPSGTTPVSEWMTVMRSIGTPSTAETIWANAVSCP